MFTKRVVSAFAASALVAGVVGIGCDDKTVTIKSDADAQQVAANCQEIKGSLVIDTDQKVNTDINLSGVTSIGGDFIAEDNQGIRTIVANDLRTIGGDLRLNNLIFLNTLQMQQLSEVAKIDFTTLNSLNSFDFGTTTGSKGITKADEVLIVDTRLSSLDGINVENPTTMNINNNKQLSNFTSSMKTLSNELVINFNALELDINLPDLEWIANMSISSTNSFSAPNLKTVNGSMRFDSNKFKSFEVPKLTETSEGDVSFVSNGDLTNISFPAITSIGGGFTIANNTKLTKVDGFPKLSFIAGAGALRGSFKEVDLPELQNVKGGFEIISTQTIESTCSTFQELKDSDGIEGKFTCDGKQKDANQDTSEAGGGSGGGSGDSGSGSGNGDDEGAASVLGMNLPTVMTIAGLGMMFTMF